MDRAQQIVDRLGEIDASLGELADELRKAGAPVHKDADFDEMMARLPFSAEGREELDKKHQRLVEERRNLKREYERLPAS
jgi:hypothetical protein